MDAHYDSLLERLATVVPIAGRVSRGDLYDLVRAIKVLAIERPNPDQLWPLHRVSAYLGLDPVLTERLLEAPGAPQPLPGAHVWRAADIYRWLDNHGRRNLKAVNSA
jgi:hypothetical protein